MRNFQGGVDLSEAVVVVAALVAFWWGGCKTLDFRQELRCSNNYELEFLPLDFKALRSTDLFASV